jgi:hypothetical protein
MEREFQQILGHNQQGRRMRATLNPLSIEAVKSLGPVLATTDVA